MFHLLKTQLNKIDAPKLTIIYKLLNDTLFIWIVLFLGAVLADGLLPGLVTSHISFLRMSILLVLNILAIYYFSDKLSETGIQIKEASGINKKIALGLVVIALLLFTNNLLGIPVIYILISLVLAIVIGWYTYKIIFEE